MKNNLQTKRSKNKNQLFKEIYSEKNRLKHINKNLQLESKNLKKQNGDLQKKIRILKLQLRMGYFETL